MPTIPIIRHRSHGMTLSELLTVIVIISLLSGVLISVYIASMRVWRRVSSQSKAFPQAYVVLNGIAADIRNAAYLIVPATPTAWQTGKSYTVGTLVVNDEISYKCLLAHTSATANEPGTTGGATYWGNPNSWITLYRPVVDTNRTINGTYLNRVPLRADLNNGVRYYLSNSSGAENTTGTYLWRKKFTQSSNGTVTSITENKKIADNVTSLSFVEDATAIGTVPRTLAITAVAITITGLEKKTSYQSSFVSYIAYENPPPDLAVTTPVF